ncbi:phosphopantetheinyl transferase [Longilinea arvoryzae]|uniref:Phosphopantetheinyl transferase n=1 Tax=Longilinea arvoryzae TaxID=360412 RepID=A0A0S7BP69_9CHLR|nr:4'-phosphopantetheinyl transferase superfamily protein [Longilinea arvoryzae]GAP15605.1 phosphopantetheinyl transferase [Longilinea arvoryzae]
MSESIEIDWAQASTPPPPPEEFLSAAELERLAGMRFPRRRAEWLLGRWTAKKLLRKVHSVLARLPLKDWSVANAANGQPFACLDGVRLAGCLSISHRSGRATCAWTPASDVGLGIDLEQVEPRTEAFVRDYFTPAEQALVAGEQRQRDTVLVWSAKEAMLKALGQGLRMDTRAVEILRIANHQDADIWNGLQIRSARGVGLNWWAGWFEAGDFVCTLAACAPNFDPKPARIEEIQWE